MNGEIDLLELGLQAGIVLLPASLKLFKPLNVKS